MTAELIITHMYDQTRERSNPYYQKVMMGLLSYIFKLERKFEAFAKFLEKRPQDFISDGEYKQ